MRGWEGRRRTGGEGQKVWGSRGGERGGGGGVAVEEGHGGGGGGGGTGSGWGCRRGVDAREVGRGMELRRGGGEGRAVGGGTQGWAMWVVIFLEGAWGEAGGGR